MDWEPVESLVASLLRGIMKRIFVLVLFFLSFALPISTRAQIYQDPDSAQRAQKAAKKDHMKKDDAMKDDSMKHDDMKKDESKKDEMKQN